MRHLTCALLAAVMLFATDSFGGVVLVSRESAIFADGVTSQDSFDLQDQLTTPGPFNSSIGDSIAAPAGGTTSASASQQSDLQLLADSLAGSASGNAAAQVAEFDAISASADSQYTVVFDVTSISETIHLSGNVQSSLDAMSRVILDDNGSNTLFSRIVDFGENNSLNFDESLALPVGRYRLLASSSVTGTPTPNSAAFDVSFNFTQGTVIPLPPAAFAGGAMLLTGLISSRGRRFYTSQKPWPRLTHQ
jgi:hypothetical protein